MIDDQQDDFAPDPVPAPTTFDWYQARARRTIGPEIRGNPIQMLNNAGLGLAGEAGEVADNIKKIIFHHRPFEERESLIREELGDILWYVSLACDAVGIPMAEIAEANITKLLKRHPGPGVDFGYHDQKG